MAEWQPIVHLEDVTQGAALRGDVPAPPILRPEAYEVGRLEPAGAPASFAVAPGRSDDRGMPFGRAGTAVVETPYEGEGRGELLLVRFDSGLRAVARDPVRSRGGRTVFTVPVSPGPQGDRGLVGVSGRWLLQKVLYPLVDPVLGRISDSLVGDWEASRRPHRVRFYTPEDYHTTVPRPAEPGDLRSGRVLLLLHGINALAHSGNGLGALPPTLLAELVERYKGQVIAFDHPTLATDPVANAAELARWLSTLDADIEVDVLGHSRGGLVARLLVERADLLGHSMRHVSFRSLTTVATPHRGTPLADPEHLGRLVDRLLTLASPVPDTPVTTALEGALTVARQVGASFLGGLDGITCMRPADSEGSWLRETLADGRRRPSGVTYRAIASDYEPRPGSGIWHAVKDAGVDLVFTGSPNDVVVPTVSALSLGAEPGSGMDDMVVFDEGDDVLHSSFFGAELVQPVLRAWLRAEPEALAGGAERRRHTAADVGSLARLGPEWSMSRALDLACLAPVALRPRLQRVVEEAGGKLWSFVTGRGGTTTPPIVVLVPGIMGSELMVGDRHVWLSPWRLAHGAFESLRLPPAGAPAVAGDVMCLGYRATLDRLARSFQVVTCPYDWREDIDLTAARLRDLLETLLADDEVSGASVHVLAHSMGGLVTRRALVPGPTALDTSGLGGGAAAETATDGTSDPGRAPSAGRQPLRDRLTARGGRIVLAGTPNHGSISTALALVGRHPVVSWLARVDLRRSLDDWLDVVWTFPGLLQLLPDPRLLGDPAGERTLEWLYDSARWGRDATEALDDARRWHTRLAEEGGQGLHLVLGDRVSTPVALRPLGSDRFEIGMAPSGDGVLARRFGELVDATTYVASGVEHGNLVKDARALQGIVDILERGSTTLLTSRSRSSATTEPPAQVEWVSAGAAEQRLTRTAAAGRGGRASTPLVWTRRDALDVGLDALSPVLGTAASTMPPLRIRLVHGSLDAATYPVVVGHATATPIGGAEARCDELLGSELSTLQIMGLYPDVPGTWRFVPRRAATDRLPGCLVLGLDSGQPLSRGVLGDLATRAVLDYAERIHTERTTTAAAGAGDGVGGSPMEGATTALGLSAVAIGSSSAFELGVERSVTAVVQAVQRANEVLAKVRRPVVEELEIIDRYAGQLERIRWAVHRLTEQSAAAPSGGQPLVLDGEVVERAGRRDGTPPPDYDSGRWEHLSVGTQPVGRDPDDNERLLTYRFARSRAAAGESPRRIDRTVVAGILADAVQHPAQSAELGAVLFEELLPVELKDELARVDNLVLQIDHPTADLPWELFVDRLAGPEPLACRVGMLRQLASGLRVRPSSSVPDTALVIGDPPSELASLPEARKEARDIAALLRGALMDVSHISFPDGTPGSAATANQVRRAFWARDHRIVHIAAHGLYRVSTAGDAVHGGVVVGPRTFLTADDFDNLRATPDLVFLNCCYLGQIGAAGDPAAAGLLNPVEQHRAAASLALALMGIGVRAVVVAGWPVDDRIASRFAEEFYGRMLDGVPYGESVKQARTACFEMGGGQDNTWASYQCYGDPAFTLLQRRRGGERSTDGGTALRSVALRRLEDVETRSAEVTDQVPLQKELRILDRQTTARWPGDGQILASLGAAWASTGAYGPAIDRYTDAVAAKESSAPLRALEQVSNLCSRRALELHRAGGDRTEVEALLAKAEHWLKVLDTLGRGTGEQQVIVASHRKRLAILRPDRRDELLRESITAYAAAAQQDPDAIYGFRNAVQLAAVSGLSEVPEIDGLVQQCLPELATDLVGPVAGTDFWHRVQRADSRLTVSLVEEGSPLASQLLSALEGEVASTARPGALEATRNRIHAGLALQVDDMAAAYAEVRVGGYSRLNWRSVVEHIADLADLAHAAGRPSAEPLRLLVTQLERIGA